MKKTLILLAALIVFITMTSAQSVADKVNKTNDNVNNTSNSINNTSDAITNTSNAVSNLSNTVGGLFKGKKKKDSVAQAPINQVAASIPSQGLNTIVINITGVDYAKLKCIKDSIKVIAGTQSADMSYSTNGSSLNVLYSGKAGELWDALSPKVSAMYNIISLNDNAISAAFKEQ